MEEPRCVPRVRGQDLLFLTDALRRGGMSYAEVAGFLGRDVGEVRDKAKSLGVESRQLHQAVPKRNRGTISSAHLALTVIDSWHRLKANNGWCLKNSH